MTLEEENAKLREQLREMTARAMGHAYASQMAEGGEDIVHQELERERQDHAATRLALRSARRAVAMCTMTGPSPIGPLHGAGWNDAVLACLNAFDAAEETPSGSVAKP